MVITSIIKQKKSNRYNIYADNEYVFSASLNDLVELGLKENNHVEESDLKLLKYKCQFRQAFDKSIKLLSIRCRSQEEVRKKLMSYDFEYQVINEVIERLKELNYINDAEFSRLFIQDSSVLRKSGKNRIVNELKRKGINMETIDCVLEQSEFNDLGIALQVIEKKLKVMHSGLDDVLTRQKIYRHLIYKGFDYETANSAIKMYIGQESQINED